MKQHAKYQTRCRKTRFLKTSKVPHLRQVGLASSQGSPEPEMEASHDSLLSERLMLPILSDKKARIQTPPLPLNAFLSLNSPIKLVGSQNCTESFRESRAEFRKTLV
jgi:hypothetical protein